MKLVKTMVSSIITLMKHDEFMLKYHEQILLQCTGCNVNVNVNHISQISTILTISII